MKRAVKYGVVGLFVLLVVSGIAVFTWQAFAQPSTEKGKTILEGTIIVEAGEQKFKAFYLPQPAEGFQVAYKVSEGKIKWCFSPATIFEESLGYYENYDANGTLIEKTQIWNEDGNGGIVPVSTSSGYIFYLLFYNEDAYDKEVTIQVTTF